MKAVSLLLLLLCPLFSVISFAQSRWIGLYLSADDYKNERLSYAVQGPEKNQIHIDPIAALGKIRVKNIHGAHTMRKDEVYACKNQDQQVFRFYKGDPYLVLNGHGPTLVIYRQSVRSGRNGSDLGYEYFFSRELTSDIKPLTMLNLMVAYPDIPGLEQKLSLTFHNDHALHGLDDDGHYLLESFMKSVH